jgi:predicted DNA-binding transcriptional regulator YafY
LAKHDYDRAMFRITTIVSRLNIGERLFLPDLASEFGVSLRTIQKDFSTRLAVFPIIRNSDGSYSFMSRYRLKGTTNAEESIVVELMGALVEQVNAGYADVTRRLLSGAGYSNRTFAVHLKFEDISTHLDTFYLLKQTIHFQQKIRFSYTTRHGKKDIYLVDPYRLGNFEGFWYLIAMDNKAGILKTFYLKSIENIRVSPENYAIDSALENEIEETYGHLTTAWFKEKKQNVNLLAVGAARRYIMRNPGPQLTIVKDAPDGLHLQMTYHRDVEVLYFVKHWLPDIRIIGNPHLKKMLMDQIKNYSG